MKFSNVVSGFLTFAPGCAELMSFEAFVQVHGRTYQANSSEYNTRRGLYEQQLALAQVQNEKPDRLWIAGVNKFWDWSEAELQSLRGWDGSARPSESRRGIRPHRSFLQQRADPPDEKIWSGLAASTLVRDQGNCGSCWAIAASTVLEAHAEIYGSPRTFSAQQIVECTPNPRACGGDGGCKGATAELAMDWVLKNGVAKENDVPYTGRDAACEASSPSTAMMQMLNGGNGPPVLGGAAFGMVGWETLPKNEYEPLVRALAERGPVAVSVAADAWALYQEGIFNGCGKDAIIDHAVTAIGYGTENGVKYWVIQNSWGERWGEEGHIRLERHPDGQYCGTNNKPELGIACKGDTAPVPVCGMCGVLFDSVVPHFSR